VTIHDNQKSDLISFYNKIFLPRIQPFIFSSRQAHNHQTEITSATPFIKKPFLSGLVMESPLRECLSQNPGYYTSPYSLQKSPFIPLSNSTQNGGTLQRVLSQGSHNELSSTFSNQNSKRQIDFDETAENNEEVLIKKRKISNAIVDKIIEQKSQENAENEGESKSLSFADKGFSVENGNNENGFGIIKNNKVSIALGQIWSHKNPNENRDRKMSFENIDPLYRTSLFGGELKVGTLLIKENEEKCGILTPEFGK